MAVSPAQSLPRADAEPSLQARLADVVRRSATTPAVVADDETLSYAALDARANAIAHALLARSFRPTAPLAVVLGQHGNTVAACLAASKLGAPWVQLQPRHPDDRNAFMLADAAATHVVSDAATAPHARALIARAGTAATLVVLGDEPASAVTLPPLHVSAEAPVLLKYTSGSSGRPRGVCLPPRAVIGAADAHTAAIGLRPGDRVASLAPLVSTVACYGTLLSGATLYLRDVQHTGIDGLAQWIVTHGITVLSTLPTVFRRLLHTLAGDVTFPAVRVVALYGEAVTRADYDAWRAHFPKDGLLWTSLGSTEALSIAAGTFTHDTPLDADATLLPLTCHTRGRRVRVIASDGNDVSPGAVGEIEIHSDEIFSGYWRRPDLTAAVMHVDPADPSQRIFRTGDLGRRLADGRLLHVGRRDRQVKIAGNRIEIAEIEQALRSAPGVREAAVICRSTAGGVVRLVAAYVVDDGDPAPNRRALRDHLGQWLPAAMLPAAFVAVDALPTLPGGKIDYETLTTQIGTHGPAYAPPRNPIEETLVEVWQRLLAVDAVGIHDDLFLDLGGDSLVAVQIMAEVATLFGRELPLAALHDASTIATLGARLLDTGWQPPADGRLVLHAGGSRPPLFAICGAYGHALRLLLIGRALGEDQPFIALQPPAMDWDRAACRTIDAMAAHYAAHIRRMAPRGPVRLLGTSIGGVLAFEVACRLQADGVSVDRLAMVDTALPSCRGPAGVERVPRHDFIAGNPAVPLIAEGIRVARQHHAALATYVLECVYRGTILYFLCSDNPDPVAVARRQLWERYATGGLDVVSVPGRHGAFHREPQRSAVVAGLRAALAKTG